MRDPLQFDAPIYLAVMAANAISFFVFIVVVLFKVNFSPCVAGHALNVDSLPTNRRQAIKKIGNFNGSISRLASFQFDARTSRGNHLRCSAD